MTIEFKNISKIYRPKNTEPFVALKTLNLTIRDGECFGLLGHNGAGKTTLINILAGVHYPTTGDVLINDLSVSKNSEKTKMLIGVVQQELIADSFFNLKTMLQIQSKLSATVPDNYWIDYLLDVLQLKDHAKKTTRELSGGMKRRMMIARALVHKPKILVLDEPTAGVDLQLRQSMWKFIEQLHENGLTIILTTHYLQEAEDFCSRIAIMKNGEIITLKEKDEILKLGGTPKISCIVEVLNIESWVQINREYLNAQKIDYIIFKKSNKINDFVKLSLPFKQGDLNSLSSAIHKLDVALQNLQISHFETVMESPNLEDIYIKINT